MVIQIFYRNRKPLAARPNGVLFKAPVSTLLPYKYIHVHNIVIIAACTVEIFLCLCKAS